MPFGGLLIAGAGLAYGAVNSAIKEHKANKIAEGLKDPVYQIPDAFKQNREIARQMAQRGLPQQQYNNTVNGIDQNNAAGLATLSRSANPGAGVTAVTRQADNARNNLDAEDAQARENNQRYFIQQNGAYGNQELQKQQNDVYDKYTRDFNQMQAYRGAAQDSLNNTISGAQQLGMGYLNAQNPATATTQNMGQKLGNPTLDASSLHQAPMLNTTMQNPSMLGQPKQPYGVKFNQWQPPIAPNSGYGMPYNWGQ